MQQRVPCPKGSRCETLGQAHYPGTKILEEHTREAKAEAASGPAVGIAPESVSGAGSSISYGFQGYDSIGDFIDEAGLAVDSNGYITREGSKNFIDTGYYNDTYGLAAGDDEEYIEEVLEYAEQTAELSDEDIEATANEYMDGVFGSSYIEAMKTSDALVAEANALIDLAHDRGGGFWDGSNIVRRFKVMQDNDLDMDHDEVSEALAKELVAENNIRVDDFDMVREDISGMFGNNITRYDGEVRLVSGEKGTDSFAEVKIPWGEPHMDGDEEYAPSPERIIGHVIGNMVSVRDSAEGFIGFQDGAADNWVESLGYLSNDDGPGYIDDGHPKASLSRVREDRDNEIDRVMEARDEAREFFAGK